MEVQSVLKENMNKIEEYRQEHSIISGNMLKFIAVLCMFVDHSCKIVAFPLIHLMSEEHSKLLLQLWFSCFMEIGSLAFPIYCFLLVEGFTYTKNRVKYLKNMFVFAMVSEVFFDMGFFYAAMETNGTVPFYLGYQNVFFTLFIGLLMLCIMEKIQEHPQIPKKIIPILWITVFFLCCMVSVVMKTDYDKIGISYIFTLYLGRKNRFMQLFFFSIPFFLFRSEMYGIYFWGMLCLLLLYNGKRGNLNLKYLFYGFYPVHLCLLFLLQRVLMFS